MAEPKGGYFISFEYSRRHALAESLEAYEKFTYDLSTLDWHPAQRNFFLIALSGEPNLIGSAAMASRTRGRTTGGHRYEFSHFVQFDPIDLDELTVNLPSGAKKTIKLAEGSHGRWFPPVVWSHLLEELHEQRPQAATSLRALWNRVNTPDLFDPSADVQRISMQRDAIGLSLDIAGLTDIRKREFKKVPSIEQAREVDSFIDLMDTQKPQERMLVNYDANIFKDIVATGVSASATFTNGRRRLRVWTVDRSPIERFTGVDLVFHNQDFNSLLLLQYKCLESVRNGGWHYRLDRQFKAELARMKNTAANILGRSRETERLEDIRLNEDAVYFKFCKRIPLVKQSGELAEGMVIALSTIEVLLDGETTIRYDNGTRFLNNTTFATLARDGWIGSHGLSSKDYREILGLSDAETDRSLVLADASDISS
ncbi:MAG: hypothetical protein WBD67_03915 [Terracidiphilus sp.]